MVAGSSRDCLVGLLHCTITALFTHDRLMLLVNTTSSLLIILSEAWLYKVGRQERATSVLGELWDFLTICTRLAFSRPFPDSYHKPGKVHPAIVAGQKLHAQSGIYAYLAHHKEF